MEKTINLCLEETVQWRILEGGGESTVGKICKTCSF